MVCIYRLCRFFLLCGRSRRYFRLANAVPHYLNSLNFSVSDAFGLKHVDLLDKLPDVLSRENIKSS
jgi:hypothetical protein